MTKEELSSCPPPSRTQIRTPPPPALPPGAKRTSRKIGRYVCVADAKPLKCLIKRQRWNIGHGVLCWGRVAGGAFVWCHLERRGSSPRANGPIRLQIVRWWYYSYLKYSSPTNQLQSPGPTRGTTWNTPTPGANPSNVSQANFISF